MICFDFNNYSSGLLFVFVTSFVNAIQNAKFKNTLDKASYTVVKPVREGNENKYVSQTLSGKHVLYGR